MKHTMHSAGHHHEPIQSVNMTTDMTSDVMSGMGMKADMNMNMDMKMDMMATSFHLDPKLTLLFEFWRPDSQNDVYLSYLILFSMGLTYEANKFFQLLFLQKFAPAEYNLACLKCCNKDYELLSEPKMNKYVFQLIFSTMYIFQFVMSMFLMLVIMTFNVQYFASIVAGVFVAHFSTNLIACREKPFEESNSNSKRVSGMDRRKESIMSHDCCS